MKRWAILLVLVAIVAGVAALRAQGQGHVGVGDAVPDIALQGTDGKVHSLAHPGKWTVLAWYPKAFTSG
ncbi:MAG: hypothetical protein ACYCW6_03850 [Candidatus Xenobia bacterium]